MTVCLVALLLSPSAIAARPLAGGSYFGFPADAKIEDSGYVEGTGALRVSRSERTVAPTTLSFVCGGDRDARLVRVRLFGRSGRHSPVVIGRDGRFAVGGGGSAGTHRLQGSFLTRGVARITYTERRSRRVVCRERMRLYRDGVAPFSGCRSQRAATLLRGETGRVFQQYAARDVVPGRLASFFAHVYVCLFDRPSKRIDLGQNYDDELLGTFRLAGPFVAFFFGGCGFCTWDQWRVEVRDVRDDSVVNRPDIRFWTRPVDLALNTNGSVAWTLERLAFGPDGYPVQPSTIESTEVWVVDGHGQRLLDSGPSLDPNSLDLNESTLTWINDGTARTATLD